MVQAGPLALHLLRLVEPIEGTVAFGGVSQDVHLFVASIRDNLSPFR